MLGKVTEHLEDMGQDHLEFDLDVPWEKSKSNILVLACVAKRTHRSFNIFIS